MTTRLTGLPMRRDDVLLVDDDARSLLLAPDQSTTLVLNPTARAIWELCDGSTRPDEMVDAICQVFSVARAAAEADVVRGLDQLTTAGLIRWGAQAGGDDA